ncbi:MAG: hypothetical protein HY904_18950 [Deltaproteobacteria bacterium]|nr:hypothetical protein [Deltaproteobacteria bacterium]
MPGREKATVDMLEQLRALDAAVARAVALARELEELRAVVLAARDRAWEELAAQVLPVLDAAPLDRACQLLGVPALASSLVLGAHGQERGELAARLAEVGPAAEAEAGDRLDALEVQQRELREWIDSVRAGVARRLADPRFAAAVTTEGAAWWTFSHWRNARAEEALLARHGTALGTRTLAELLDKHRAQADTLKDLEAQQAALSRERALTRSRVGRARDLAATAAGLDARHLGLARKRVVEALGALKDAALLRTSAGVAGGAAMARRVLGLGAKARYLDALRTHVVAPVEASAREHAQRIAQAMEAGLANVAYAREDVAVRLVARLDEARALVDRLIAFDAYERYAPEVHPLWWDWFMDGEEPGTHIPEVAVFRAEHRGVVFRPPAVEAAPPSMPVDPFYQPGRELLFGSTADTPLTPDDDDDKKT